MSSACGCGQVLPVGHPLQPDGVPDDALGGIVIAKLRAGQELKLSCLARKARCSCCLPQLRCLQLLHCLQLLLAAAAAAACSCCRCLQLLPLLAAASAACSCCRCSTL